MIAALFANRTNTRSRFKSGSKLLAFAAIVVVLALSIGGALGGLLYRFKVLKP